ncbi:hypothetical protein NDK47_02010 [Brevibacillus ruminantium]|uniref:Uncharacterized protein n=1 Tax=Brevibacillus ruminantium TaxID=2950604 RepID=A0ABY4WG43_9BACL|nr:spore germination protein GerPC [Brevibacillus ruminantium]USG66135.1 hypothetical protein NDK47_02010 [Brevibacillus ruminantium]
MMLNLYRHLQQIQMRISLLTRRCNRIEAALESWQEITQLKLEMVKMKVELEKMKSHPTQIVIQKLENKVDNLDVTTLNGILNIGVAQNHSGAAEGKQLSIGGKSLEDLLSGKKEKEKESEETHHEQQGPTERTQEREHQTHNENAKEFKTESQNKENTHLEHKPKGESDGKRNARTPDKGGSGEHLR